MVNYRGWAWVITHARCSPAEKFTRFSSTCLLISCNIAQILTYGSGPHLISDLKAINNIKQITTFEILHSLLILLEHNIWFFILFFAIKLKMKFKWKWMLQHLDPHGDSYFAIKALRTTNQCLHLGHAVRYFLPNLNSMEILQWIYSGIYKDKMIVLQNWKLCLRYFPFRCNCKVFPSRFSRRNVLFSLASMILNGPYQRGSNFPCFPLSSLPVSHLNTRSPTLK